MLFSISRIFLFSFCLVLFLETFAQETSPYSRFGLGDIQSPAFAPAKGMGGLISGYRDAIHLNILNPASYPTINLTTLEAGVNFYTKQINDASKDVVYQTGDGFIDYIAFGFPVAKNAGISMGMIPYSKMKYDFSEVHPDSTIGTKSKTYSGSGRTYQIYVGGAYKFYDKDTAKYSYSIGLNAMYLFGKLTHNDQLEFESSSLAFNSRLTTSLRLSNVALNPGFQFNGKLKENGKGKLFVTVGTYSYFPIISASKQDTFWTQTGAAGVVDSSSVRAKDLKIPPQIGVGIIFDRYTTKKNRKLTIGIDVIYTIWSKFKNINKGNLKDSWKFMAGMEFRPDFMGRSLLKRMHYRLGGYYDTGYLQVKNTNISEYGITFGLGVPIKSIFSRLNFSFDVGFKGTETNNLIKETYFKSYIGLTFNDKWFIKRKYD